jgi:hypothetical protein
MEPTTNIDALVARFAALPGARVGFGPRHPTNPDPALADKVARLFDEIPALTRDRDYVNFMWRYAGISRRNGDDTDFFDIFGFSSAAVNFDEFEEPLIEDDGSFMFAEAVVHEGFPQRLDTYTVGFAFNVDPDREWAVYRATQQTYGPEERFSRYLNSFLDFLADAVERGGRYPRIETG